jgi:hypothetical protein
MSSALEIDPEAHSRPLWYVYGVVPGELILGDKSDWPSVGQAGDVELVREGALAAVASPVAPSEFDQPNLDSRVQEADWLEEKIRAHEQVLELVLGRSAVVPFRFCTVYRSREALRAFLAEHRSELEATLERIRGKVERGVKAFADRSRLAQALTTGAEEDSVGESRSGGRAYLERRLAEQRNAEELERLGLELIGKLHARLDQEAEESTFLPLQTREVSGRSEDMLMNAAFLVEAESPGLEHALADLRREFEPLGMFFELTGPWPPYNFVPGELA